MHTEKCATSRKGEAGIGPDEAFREAKSPFVRPNDAIAISLMWKGAGRAATSDCWLRVSIVLNYRALFQEVIIGITVV